MSTSIEELIIKYKEQLTIKDLLVELKYEINELYVDKFWENISNDKWIYINDEMLEWLGYESIREIRSKEYYIKLLNTNFVSMCDYKQLNSSELKDFYTGVDYRIEMPKNINEHNKVKHLLVSPRCFKESLMLMNTKKAKIIRKYYLDLEEVFKFYLQYQSEYMKHQLINQQKELNRIKYGSEMFKQIIIQKNTFKQDEFIYVATSKNYASRNIFKIGTTKLHQGRLRGYQTGRCEDDKFKYLYIMRCVSGKELEQLIFNRLRFFSYRDDKGKVLNELFEIDYHLLLNILKEFEKFEEMSTNNINNYLLDYYETYIETKPINIDDYVIENLNEYMKNKFEITPDTSNAKDELYVDQENKSKLTNTNINETLKPYNIQLLDEYKGNSSDVYTFECMSIFKHKINITYDHMMRTKENGCSFCRKHGILDQADIYVYHANLDYTNIHYAGFDELKVNEPNINHQLLRNIIREERWLTTHENKIYSILSPDDKHKLNLKKKLTEKEDLLIKILDINYVLLSSRLTEKHDNYIVAIDHKYNKIYYSNSATIMDQKLKYVDGIKKINRKTISKYLDSENEYGGYIWKRSTDISEFNNLKYEIIYFSKN